MSGHSKWASIKHKKAATDAKRGNSFTKLANAVTVAAKQGGGDPVMNPTLRTAIDKARSANMPKDNIDRAIKRGTGELGGAIVEEMLYEGFGPAGVAILVEAVTDNRNRANGEIRMIFNKNGGRMPEGGGIAYQFESRGVIRLNFEGSKSDQLEELIIEAGAEDYRLGDEFVIIYTAPAEVHRIKDALESASFSVDSAKIERIASTPIEISDSDMEKLERLLDALDDNDDVTNIYTNLAE